MTKSEPGNKPRKPKRRWLKRIGWTALGLLTALAIFHRPLLRAAIHFAAVKAAASQHLQLTLEVEGSVLTNLVLKNVHAFSAGKSPVEKIDLGEVRVRYSLPGLARHGATEFLRDLEIKNARIILAASDEPKPKKPDKPLDVNATLRSLLRLPALLGERVNLENVSFTARSADGDLVVENANLLLDQTQPGFVKIARVQIPKVRTWKQIAAATSFKNRDLILRGLKLDENLQVTAEFDASRRAEDIYRAVLDAGVVGGTAQVSLTGNNLSHEPAGIKTEANVKNISLEKLTHYLDPSAPRTAGNISDLSLDFSGDPNVPASWNGQATALMESLTAGGAAVDRVVTKLVAKDGAANVDSAMESGSNKLTLAVASQLPKRIQDFPQSELNGQLRLDAADLARLNSTLTSGTVSSTGTFGLRDGKLTATLDLAAANITTGSNAISSAAIHLQLTKLPGEKRDAPALFDGLQTRITASFRDVRLDEYAIDSGSAQISSSDAKVRLEQLALRRDQNAVIASGEAELPRDMKSFQSAPVSVKFDAKIPSLAAFNNEPDLTAPNAQAEASGTISNGANGCDGKINASVSNITYRDFAARNLALDITIAKNVATINALTFSLNDTDGFSARGSVGLRAPFVYDGTLAANVRDLSKFNALVPQMQDGLAGLLALDWQGRGNFSQMQHSGHLQFSLSNGKGAGMQAINAAIAGSYAPELIDMPTFWITWSKGDLAAVIGLKNNVLTMNNISAKLAGKPVLTGSASLPLDLRTPKNAESIVPLDGPVSIDLKTPELDLEALAKLQSSASDIVKKNPSTKNEAQPAQPEFPVRGTATATLSASGTVAELDARLLLAVRNLQAKAASKFAPATVDLDARLIQDQLSLKGRVQQQAIQPIEIAGTLPLPIKQIVKQKKIDEKSPVQLSVRLPKSSVAFLSQLTPAIRYLEGTASINADLGGTIAQPQLSGSAQLDLPAVRLKSADAPAINGFKGDLNFSGNQLTISRFGGEISGGPFNLAGKVQLAKLNEPMLDLRLTSQGALLVRNESLTVRADSDVRVNGPLNSALVTGTVGITKSKFFREVEILPIELPGRPAPKPPETGVTVSFPNPPLRDWKFDVAIKTNDPFLIRGNLTNGAAYVDLRLVGTGRTPALDGTVRIENFLASLPFSKLEVSYGYVYFTPDDPFVPTLDIQGTSNLRDYNINVYIYGTPSDPQTVFSSEPPLPQEDILSLLATGTTTEELTGHSDVLAGRAAVLIFQRFYRKIFKQKEPSENESFLDRFQVDVGGVDPRTGKQEASARFKLAEKFYLIGDLDVQGAVRGQVKYLLRFR